MLQVVCGVEEARLPLAVRMCLLVEEADALRPSPSWIHRTSMVGTTTAEVACGKHVIEVVRVASTNLCGLAPAAGLAVTSAAQLNS
ncbi:g1465 [Coccomyxa elongata]